MQQYNIPVHIFASSVRKKYTSIPVNIIDKDSGTGIAIERFDLRSLNKLTPLELEDAKRSHREDRHSFFLLETGTINIEIDFQKHTINSPSIIYMHPDQVHRILAFEDVTVCSLAINNENLPPEYLELLEGFKPAQPLALAKDIYFLIAETMSLCIKFSEYKHNKLYHQLLRDSCNTLVALVIAQYLEQAKTTDKLSRFEVVTQAFKYTLERNYTTTKRPAAYALALNISTPYLNECVSNATGYSVSYHIQQRVILEAKRLLHHSSRSVKEIASELGYDDYPYFSRLFTKVVGISALAFRNKNIG